MKPAPTFLFACVVAAVSGAVGGAAIDTNPIQRAGVGTPEFLRDPAPFEPSSDALAQAALPDHYDMLTPSGRVEVAELTTYGLRSQRRFGWSEPPPLPPLMGEPQAEDSWRRTEGMAIAEAPATVSEPPVSSEGGSAMPEAATAVPTGSARIIHVPGALSGG